MKKLLAVIIMLIVLVASAQAITTDAGFDYDAIAGYAHSHYGEVYTIVGRAVRIEEYHRSSDTTIVEEYTQIAVDGDEDHIVCVHYTRPKNLTPMPIGSYVAIIAYVDGVQRIDSVIIPLMEANSNPMILEEK